MKENSIKRHIAIGIVINLVIFSLLGIYILLFTKSTNGVFFYVGLIVGSFTSYIVFINLYNVLDFCLELNPKEAESIFARKSILRKAIVVILMVAAVLINNYLFGGYVAGVFGLKTAALLNPIISKSIK